MGTIRHLKTDAIPDATQAELNAAIALGQYPPGTTLADIVLPSDWNDNHAINLTNADVGLSNVDNTSDANKPISTATQTALNAKQATLVSGTNIKTINGTTLLGAGDIVTGTGDVVGPASSVDNRVVFFNGLTGKLIKDSGLTLSGTNTGDQTSVTGNAGTATALQTGRLIYGNSFNGTADLTQVIAGTFGGTGVNNAARTITYGGNVTFSGAFTFTGAVTANTSVTFPTAGTLLSTAAAVTVAQGGTGLATLTSGSLIVGAGTSTPTFLAPGSDGNVAVVAGGVWTSAPPSGGSPGLVLLGTPVNVTVAVASVDITSLITSAYEEYEIHIQNAVPATAAVNFLFRTSSNNGSSFDSGGGDYNHVVNYSITGTPTPAGNGTTGASSIVLAGGGGLSVDNTVAVGGWSGVIRLINPAGTANNKQAVFDGTWPSDGTTGLVRTSGCGARLSTGDVDAVRFLFSSGNIASGLFKIYGVRKS